MHILNFSPGRKLARLRLEREAEKAGKAQSFAKKTLAEQAATGDPILWDAGRIERRGGRWYFVEVGEPAPVPGLRPLSGGH